MTDISEASHPNEPAGNPNNNAQMCPVVGIGASAGGLEALETLFRNMPGDLGAAFVVVQHLAPHAPSILAELLRKATSMPVTQALNKSAVMPNHVYVIPPNASLGIRESVLHVTIPGGARYARVDEFFCSLAEDLGTKVICVILSGSGSDGMRGLKAIKEHGGMAMAQAIESAQYDGMPRSAIALGLVDHVLPVEQMPATLAGYLAHLERTNDSGDMVAGEEASAALHGIWTILQQKTEHDFSHYKQSTLLRRIHRRMLVLQIDGLERYVQRLEQDAGEVHLLFRDLLIGVTQFFRNPTAFAVLQREVIPTLIAGKSHDEDVRVWVPGCASGGEAYSLAILLYEAGARLGRSPGKVFATDIDVQAVDTARRGCYPESIRNQLSAERLDEFFVKKGRGYQVCQQIRDMCIFSVHNIISDPPFSRMDLVSCRNLLMYLDGDVQKMILPLFHYALRSQGYLFLGPSENITSFPDLFRVVDGKSHIFQRKEAFIPPPLAFFPGPPTPGRPAVTRFPPALSRHRSGMRPQSARFERILLDDYAPAATVIRRTGEVVFVSGRTSKYLELPPGITNVNIVDMARREIRPDLRSLIHKAVTSSQQVSQRGVMVEVNDGIQRIDLTVRPLIGVDADSELLMVVFREVDPPLSKAQAANEGLIPRTDDSLMEALEAELQTTKAHLKATIEELEASNEELSSANEELLSTNEEMQSAYEETQTAREELQSLNEELHTVNTELKRKIEELDNANSDLHNLFASTQIPTIFLDDTLAIKKFSPAATQVFRLIDGDAGRPITDIAPAVTDTQLIEHILEVCRTHAPLERQVRAIHSDKWYLRRILPYKSGDSTIAGVVITFTDITELKDVQDRASHLANMVECSYDPIIGMTPDRIITSWNVGAARVFGYPAREAYNQHISILYPPDKATTEEIEHAYEKLERGECVEPFETIHVRGDNTTVDVILSLSRIVNITGQTSGICAIAYDVTDRKRAEQAVQEANRRKTEFLALLAHELRNPLASMRNAVHLLRRFSPAAEQPVQRARDIIDRQTGHMAHLVGDLLDVGRISTGKILLHKQRTDLVGLVAATVEDYRHELEVGGVALDITLPEQSIWVMADPTRLSQVVGNLLHNASKFTDEGGRVSIVLRDDGGGDAAVLQVKDTGIGMDKKTLEMLFEPFVQDDPRLELSRGGLRLGLSVVKGMVELHGGSVRAQSEGPGRGSSFTIRLPLDPGPPAAEPSSPPPTTAPQRSRILVIEDNEDAAESLQMLLELWGHRVDVAHDGLTGIDKARQFKPDVVLCDIGLPADMDGYAVSVALRQDPAVASVYLIAMTGYGMEEDKQRALAAGFDRHLTKPVDPSALQDLLSRLPPRG